MNPPLVSGREAIAALKRLGFVEIGQKGSHVKLKCSQKGLIIIVPNHREVDRWTLRGILRSAEVSVQEFIDAL